MEQQIYYSQEINLAFKTMFEIAEENRNEFTTPEHFLIALTKQDPFYQSLLMCGASVRDLRKALYDYIDSLDA